jgi:hypothetical protein
VNGKQQMAGSRHGPFQLQFVYRPDETTVAASVVHLKLLGYWRKQQFY